MVNLGRSMVSYLLGNKVILGVLGSDVADRIKDFRMPRSTFKNI
ncbi:hypothetical protein SPJ1_0419 [Streptococcus parauberis KRS-02083]|uniref:Uncharacterized protein n=1 Tax=Streptococcus parauberis KRS-02083 TaxID=1207545 RepID=A0ABP2T1C0_9STRE|nr:hypothetical protein SPJ1_0419 [Streptococcus parauberis KRS-02083]